MNLMPPRLGFGQVPFETLETGIPQPRVPLALQLYVPLRLGNLKSVVAISARNSNECICCHAPLFPNSAKCFDALTESALP